MVKTGENIPQLNDFSFHCNDSNRFTYSECDTIVKPVQNGVAAVG